MKIKFSSIIVAASIFLSTALSHELWVNGKNEDVIIADIIYGEEFLKPEKISRSRVDIFEPIKLYGQNQAEINLTQTGVNNYHYEKKVALKDGVYILEANYKPTSWLKDRDGKWYINKTRKDINNTEICSFSTMKAKYILAVGDSVDEKVTASKKGLEFTLLNKAGDLVKDRNLTFKLLNNGKPVKKARIYGSTENFLDDKTSSAFYTVTDENGEFNFKALKEGFWYLKTTILSKSLNPDCEKNITKTTITFEIK